MLVAAIGTRLVSGAQAIVDVPPVFGRRVGRIDAEGFDGIDGGEDALDLRPAADAQQDLAAGTDERQRLIGFAWRDRAHDVDARDNGAEVVRGPADEGEDGVWREAQHTAAAIDDCLGDIAAEPDPVLDALFEPGEFDGRKGVGRTNRCLREGGIRHHVCPPSVAGNSRARRSRSMSATVWPRWKAVILIRARSSGVTSTVSRAVKSSPALCAVADGSGVRTQDSG